MSIKRKLKGIIHNNKDSILFWVIASTVSLFSFGAGYLIAFEVNPVPIIIEKCSSLL